MLRSAFIRLILFVAVTAGLTAPAHAVPITSKCLAVAERLAPIMRVAHAHPGPDRAQRRGEGPRRAQLADNQVRVTYVGHSTFIIESARGVRIATDYAGWHGPGPVPDVVTMNHAHETHYTDHPDPAIKHVLRGWNPEGGHAEHNLTVEDVYIRNVPTNIRTWVGGGTEKFGNSIFIFEVGGLCIGHLGHLHHELTAQQLGQIGQLDVVMAPVDGTFTLDHAGMLNVLKELRARIVIPMHYFGSLDAFLEMLQPAFTLRRSDSRTVVLSPATMPLTPEVLVLTDY